MARGISYELGRAWGRMSFKGRLISGCAVVGVLLSPLIALQVDAFFEARRQEAAQAATAERLRLAREREQARIAALTPEQHAAEAAARAKRAEAAKAAAAAEAAAQAAASERKAKRTGQLQMAGMAAVQLKHAMKDPEAFTLTSVSLMPSGAACYDYRAKNSFGATMPSSAVMTSARKILLQERDGNTFVRAWNKECTAAGGEDITAILKRVM